MKTAIILQARMSSTRLPGKVLRPVKGKPLLLYQIERLRLCCVPLIILATTTSASDTSLAQQAQQWGLPVFRGSEDNVLERYLQAAHHYQVDQIVRITGDCPLIDPDVIDDALLFFQQNPCDYLSNTLVRTYPRGLDVEIFTYTALKKAQTLTQTPSDLEHVTPVLYRSGHFQTAQFEHLPDFSQYRLCVDTEEDFQLIQKILSSSLPHPTYTLEELIALLENHPEWVRLNQDIKQKEI